MIEELNLNELWQSDAPDLQTEDILMHIELEQRSETHLGWALAAVTAIALAATAYIEIIGALRLPGLLFAVVAGASVAQWWGLRRARERRPALSGIAPRAALELALGKARRNLKLARGLQLWLPAGVLAGYAAGPLLSRDATWYEPPAWLDTTLLVVIVAVLGAAVAVGTLIARDAKYRISVLESRLAHYEDV